MSYWFQNVTVLLQLIYDVETDYILWLPATMAAWFYGFSTLIFWSAFKSLIELNPEKHLF